MNAVARLAGPLAIALALPAVGAGSGLTLPPDALMASNWQARFEFDQPTMIVRSFGSPWALGQAPWALGQTHLTGRLFSDYRIDALRFGQTGGFKLTSGVVVNLRAVSTTGLAFNTDGASVAQPYAGIGYSGAGERGDWSFSAELGLAAQNPGAATQFGRLFNGVSFGDAVRDLRIQPMIRLGMNYAF